MVYCRIILSLFFIASYENEAALSHSLRHHQHGGSKNTENDTEVTAPTPDLVVRPHEEVFLSCFIPDATSSRIGFGVAWLHNGLVVDTDNIGRHRRDPASGQLHISSIRIEDDGLWQCQFQGAEMDHPSLSKPLKLLVLDKPRNPYLLVDNRRLDPGNLFIPVKEGQELHLSCIVEGGNPPPAVKWLLVFSETTDPAEVADDRGTVSLNVTGDANMNHVTAFAITRSDARLDRVQRAHHNATIVCIIHHPALKSPTNTSLLLDVQYTPSFAISREPGFGFPLREGLQVALKCDVDSNPPANPIWLKDDGSPPVAQSVDGFLNFSSIKREHSGWYKCTATHFLGEFSSIGYFLNVRSDLLSNFTDPQLDPYPSGRQVEVPLGGNVQLQCPEEAMGCWSRLGPTGRLEPVGPGPGLFLQNVIYQDAGEYRCASSRRADFDRWRSEVNVDVTVVGRPLVYPTNEELTVQTGHRIEMSVEFCANPPPSKAFWVTNTHRISPGLAYDGVKAHNFTMGSSIHCRISVLAIQRVLPTHSGEYMFLVQSSYGLTEGTFTLNVTRASGYSSSRGSSQNWTAILPVIVLISVIFK